MDDEIQSIMRREIWDIVSRKSVADHNVIPGTCYFKCNRKTYWKIIKFKAPYCVRGDVQKRIYPKPLNSYSPVVQWATGEYEFRGLGDNRFWIPPLTQYRALNFLIVQSGFLLHLKDHVPGSTL